MRFSPRTVFPNFTETLLQFYDSNSSLVDYRLTMEEWQYKAAFVIQFRAETDIADRRFEGRIEHIATHEATRFHSLDQLLAFITSMLSKVRNTDEQ